MRREIRIVRGDITTMRVDAIVNAAHEGLCGGGGVDGAIHQAAGQRMTGECLNLPANKQGERCPVGECRMTGGYDLPALYVIHTVGPTWGGEERSYESKVLLARCYHNCLDMARMQGLRSMAFPCISTGAFCFPKDEAANVAMRAMYDHMVRNPGQGPGTVYIVCFDDENYQEYLKLVPGGTWSSTN